MKSIAIVLLMTIGLAFAQEAATEKLTAGPFTFDLAKAWTKEAKARPMSKGTVTHTPKDGKPISASFYHMGGGVAANLKRWKGQFVGESKVDQEELTFGEQKVILVHITGTFLAGAPMARQKVETPDQGMLGAIIPTDSGEVFVKTTGPKADIDATKAAFRALVTSAFAKK